MKRIWILLALAAVAGISACEKDVDKRENDPQAQVPAAVQGRWMYGRFSMTEYWNQNPADYIGNALEIAIAFQFEPNGKYTQYFTSSSVLGGISTYQQSVSKGTVEVDAAAGTIKTHPVSAHYKRTRYGQVLEERDLEPSELSGVTTYRYTTGTEASGTKALYLTLGGTSNPLTFLKQ